MTQQEGVKATPFEFHKDSMNMAIRALALEIPELVWRDVNNRWQAFLKTIPTQSSPPTVSELKAKFAEHLGEKGGLNDTDAHAVEWTAKELNKNV